MELIGITPGMVGQYLVAPEGSASKRNLHLSALRGFFDLLVKRRNGAGYGQDRPDNR
jgi:hypothetical protein